MAAITLPTSPAPRVLDFRLVPPARELRPAMGAGAIQRLISFQRWVFDFQLPPMTYVEALAWEAVFSDGDTVIMPILEPGLTLPSYGTPLVNGADQSGSSLDIDGLGTAEIVKGKWLSIVTTARRYVYRTTAAVTPASGAAELSLRPLLRASPANNAVVELAAPKVEGFVTLASGAAAVTADRLVRGLRFSIEEAR